MGRKGPQNIAGIGYELGGVIDNSLYTRRSHSRCQCDLVSCLSLYGNLSHFQVSIDKAIIRTKHKAYIEYTFICVIDFVQPDPVSFVFLVIHGVLWFTFSEM